MRGLRRRLAGARGDAGNAMLEFVLLAIVLMIPLVYVMLFAFQLQRAAFAVSAAAREAGRAYVTADSADDAPLRAQTAADIALDDQLPGSPTAAIRYADPSLEDGRLEPGEAIRVSVTYVVDLPLLGDWAHVPVTGTHVATVDRYRSP